MNFFIIFQIISLKGKELHFSAKLILTGMNGVFVGD